MLKNVSVVIPVAPGEAEHAKVLPVLHQTDAEILVRSDGSRTASLNMGGQCAQRDYLWFVHADTLLTTDNITALEQCLQDSPTGILYFDLQFEGGGLVALNAALTNVRSRLFGLPYGDQGFCMSRAVFETLGGYPDDLGYGEDLLLIRLAKRRGIPIVRLPSQMRTSARKYHQQGWLRLTMYRQRQLWQLMRHKI